MDRSMDVTLWRARFREHLQLGQYSPRTVAGYVGELGTLFAFLAECGVESLGSVTREIVEEYRNRLFYLESRGNRLSSTTQNRRLHAVKTFFRFLAEEDFLLIDPAAEVKPPRTPGTLPRVILSEPETARVLEAPDVSTTLGLRDRAILEVLYGTAIRNSELSSLTLDAVDLARYELRVHCGKGGRSRVLPLGEEAAAWLEAYLVRARPQLVRRPGEALVFLTWRGLRFTRAALSDVVRRAAREAGVTKGVTPHVLRHCCATHMLRHGAGLRHLQELLGHASVETTQRYTRLETSDLRRVLRRCHPRERRERS